MSLEYLSAAFCLPIKGAKKSILIALADRANKAGYCYPSIEDTAFRIGLSERTVIRSVIELEELGFLAVIRETGRANKYILLIEKLPTTSDIESGVKVINSHDRESPTRDRVSKNPCQSVTLTIIEPSLTIKERDFLKTGTPKTKNQINSQLYKIFNKLRKATTNQQQAKGELKNIKSVLSGGVNYG